MASTFLGSACSCDFVGGWITWAGVGGAPGGGGWVLLAPATIRAMPPLVEPGLGLLLLSPLPLAAGPGAVDSPEAAAACGPLGRTVAAEVVAVTTGGCGWPAAGDGGRRGGTIMASTPPFNCGGIAAGTIGGGP